MEMRQYLLGPKIEISRFSANMPASSIGTKPAQGRWRMNKKTLVLESSSPFGGRPELGAYDEGLFAKEGVEVVGAERDQAEIKTADTSITDVKKADKFVSHGT